MVVVEVGGAEGVTAALVVMAGSERVADLRRVVNRRAEKKEDASAFRSREREGSAATHPAGV